MERGQGREQGEAITSTYRCLAGSAVPRLDLQSQAQLLTKPVYKSPGHVSRNLNYAASLPLTPLGTGDQPEPERLLTLRLASDSRAKLLQQEMPSWDTWRDTA